MDVKFNEEGMSQKRAFLPTVIALLLFLCVQSFCFANAWNNPHPKKGKNANVLYTSFAERPKTLDPARAYSSNEYLFISQIYEPPLQYHYLLRPYRLVSLTAVKIPEPKFFDKTNKPLSSNASNKMIAYSVYTVTITPGILYQPHPAFAKDKRGKYLYHQLSDNYLIEHKIYKLVAFKKTGTRELCAEDYVYEIKRLAHPRLNSPIFGLMSTYVLGLSNYRKVLKNAFEKKLKDEKNRRFLDLRQYPLEGVKVLSRYSYQIKIKGKYPQFKYWLAMPFFAPIPWEADKFYSQPNMLDRNISFDWYPVGTGPYMLTKNNPNRKMVLKRNPNFHTEYYPKVGAKGDKEKGLLIDAGKRLPFIDKVIFSLEKESIPRWSKFLQGYYDSSSISSDSFDQAIHIDAFGKPHLTKKMRDRGIRLNTSIGPSIFYMGFNMLDITVGGYSERARKLRQAISIALDYEEFIAIFNNGRGIPAQGPIPPGIFGHRNGKVGINTVVYQWVDGKAKRNPLVMAKNLLEQAGYPNGRDAKTGKPLILNYDVPASSGPDDKARFNWLRKQFGKLGIQLNIRATQYNRFQEKMRTGNAQLFNWGWNADYPDPENFLFLLYGPNGKVKFAGENAANYNNPEFNALFEKMKNLENGPERQKLIDKMLALVRRDAPWIWGFNPQNFQLIHAWNRVSKPNEMANNTLKYARIDTKIRSMKRSKWNKPIIWPLVLLFVFLVAAVVSVTIRYWRKEHQPYIGH